eukprot:2517673-Amphidinium_carterae.1
MKAGRRGSRLASTSKLGRGFVIISSASTCVSHSHKSPASLAQASSLHRGTAESWQKVRGACRRDSELAWLRGKVITVSTATQRSSCCGTTTSPLRWRHSLALVRRQTVCYGTLTVFIRMSFASCGTFAAQWLAQQKCEHFHLEHKAQRASCRNLALWSQGDFQ